MGTPFPTSTLQFLGRFNPDCNLLARVDFCQGDFQHLVLNGGRHIVWIYLMRQFENAEHLSRTFFPGAPLFPSLVPRVPACWRG